LPKFSSRSRAALDSCDARLVRLFDEVVKRYDCAVLEGRRSKERQAELVRAGKSKTMNSKHLRDPSMACDVVPYPVDWTRRGQDRMRHFAGYVFGVANQLGISGLVWGGDWDGDVFTDKRGMTDQSFYDLPHFELSDE